MESSDVTKILIILSILVAEPEISSEGGHTSKRCKIYNWKTLSWYIFLVFVASLLCLFRIGVLELGMLELCVPHFRGK